jgi:hypothetical protein
MFRPRTAHKEGYGTRFATESPNFRKDGRREIRHLFLVCAAYRWSSVNSADQCDSARHRPGRSGCPVQINSSTSAISGRHLAIHLDTAARSSATC